MFENATIARSEQVVLRMARRSTGGGDLGGFAVLVVLAAIVAAFGWLIDFVTANQQAVLVSIAVGSVLIIIVVIARRLERSRQERAKVEEAQRLADLRTAKAWQRRERLMMRYDDEIVVQAIIDGEVWHDMSKEQLLESWGPPEDVKTTTLRTKIREEYKYGCVGVNRYSRRVYIENDVVIGWKR